MQRATSLQLKMRPENLRTIMIEVGSVKSIFEVLELLVQGHGEALAAFRTLFPVAQYEPADGKRMEILSSLTNLAWHFEGAKLGRPSRH